MDNLIRARLGFNCAALKTEHLIILGHPITPSWVPDDIILHSLPPASEYDFSVLVVFRPLEAIRCVM